VDEHLWYSCPSAFVELRHMYWKLRACRAYDQAARRKWYRRIRNERERLEAAGWPAEHLRLYCRYMSNPVPDSPALRRLWAYEKAADVVVGILRRTKAISTNQPKKHVIS